MKLVGVGVNVKISGLNENDLANITCRQESSYIINTDSQSVQARCLNGSWTGNWEANFDDDGKLFFLFGFPLTPFLPILTARLKFF